MKIIKTFTIISVLTIGITQSAFALWWNPFTWFQKKVISVQQVQQNNTNTHVQNVSSTLNESLSTDNTRPDNEVSFKIIKCNPKTYDENYFIKEKPCVSDVNSIDKEREFKASKIIKEIEPEGSPWREGVTLYVSDERYQLLNVNFGPKIGYIVVDTVNNKVSDRLVFRGSDFVHKDNKRIIFTSGLRSNPSVSLMQYIYGTEKLVTIKDSEIVEPKTYLDGQSLETDNGIKVLASSTDSITLGIYDKNEAIKKPEIYWVSYKQIGTKVIDLNK
ncbi:MAG: hypothetical protein KBC41_01495 [Candidatus Pacebacteria bacterium]|nr:hypothetical protein [Candidatus Paceibacterota bacterium]